MLLPARFGRRWRLAMTLLVPAAATASHAQASRGPWRQYATPEDAGFSSQRLDQARHHADSVRSGAVMIVHRGIVVAAWGDVSRKLELHSVRKSLVNALFGVAVDAGRVNLDHTLGASGIDDKSPLMPLEQGARIGDLLAARSGVYLPSAYAGREQDEERPARGSHAPGSFFFYNNWDFNVAGVLYERLVEPDLFAAFARRIAQPLGMEDFLPTDGFKVYEPSGSVHPAHTFRMSARDLARFGQLFLQRGTWDGRSLLSPRWVDESTRPHSDLGGGTGYGYLWWTYARGSLGARYPRLDAHDMYAARGTGGQFVLVIPDEEIVIVHRGDTDNGREVRGPDVWRIAELALAARTGGAVAAPRTVPLQPVAFASQVPARTRPSYVQLSASQVAELSGSYEVTPDVVIRVFPFADRLFANFPGQGEAELLGLTPDEFTIMPVEGVRVRFERDAAGRVSGLSARIGRQEFKAKRRQ